uniref:Uncharacterized protein n=1 Tax=Parastrongyloides trichosuri TaxID=131310 RepID=A0A0N5A136_PARTI
MSSISNEINLNFKEICQDKLSECQIFKNARFLDTTEVVQFLFTPLVTSIKEISKNKTVDESIIVNGIKYKSAADFIKQMNKTTVYNSIQDESDIRNISVNNNNNDTIPFNVMFGF